MSELPEDVVDVLIRAKKFMPLYMPTKDHEDHNKLALDILNILKKYELNTK